MSSQSIQDDISDGDLGLGEGLKPGGIPVIQNFSFGLDKTCDEHLDSPHQITESASFNSIRSGHSGFTTPEDSDDEFEISLVPIHNIQELKAQYSYLNSKTTSRRCQETCPKSLQEDDNFYDDRYFQRDATCDNDKCLCPNSSNDTKKISDDSVSAFPTYANVPYGTSIRQQKELFQHNIEELRKKMHKNLSNEAMDTSKECIAGKHHTSSSKKQSCEEIAMKFAETLQDVEELKAELENCEKRLDSKYKAIEILKHQAEESQTQLKSSEKMSKDTTMKLAQEINELQFELQWRETAILDNQQLWAQRFDRMCQDNKSLTETLEVRTEDLRKITAQKMAVERENDELLALLDIQERAKYEKSRSVSSEENYCTFSSTELAVLGACRCRVTEPDPCGCAHAAANLKREIIRMKEQLIQYKNRRDEAFLTVDVYRKAFEEQLQRNKSLSLQLISLGSSNQPRTSKTKSALRWLIGNLSEDDPPDDCETVTPGPAMTQQELITYLSEMLHEKKEVLAHQKLAAQILADRVKTLEAKLAIYEKEDHEVFH